MRDEAGSRIIVTMKRLARYVSGFAIVAIVSGGVALAWKARNDADALVTNPMAVRRLPTQTPVDFGLVYDDVAITARDGARLVAWYVPTINGAVILAQHGYKSQRGEMLNEALMLTSICGLGQVALVPAVSVLQNFPEEVASRVKAP